MDSRFWVYYWKLGNAHVKQYVWSRQDIPLLERRTSDEKFLRSGPGKKMRAKFWQNRNADDSSREYEEPRVEVELLAMCVRDTETEICGAPDFALLKRVRLRYLDKLHVARHDRADMRRLKRQNEQTAMVNALALERFKSSSS